jgi:hypothetical protein
MVMLWIGSPIFRQHQFKTLEEILDEFRKRWGDQKEHRFQLNAITNIKKKENETMLEFNTKFNNLVKDCHKDIKPSDAAILISYVQAFEGEIRYALVDKEPQDLITAQKYSLIKWNKICLRLGNQIFLVLLEVLLQK